MVKIGVLVSGGGTNLQAILDAEKNGILTHGRVSLVLSSKEGVYALERAALAGVSAAVLPRKAYEHNETYCEALAERLKDIELIVLAGFMTVLSPAFCKRFEGRILNVHPSLIPSFCGDGFYGLRVHEAALARGVKLTGATVHLVNEITDGGLILAQKSVAVLEGDTAEDLQKRVMEEAEWVILPQAIEKICMQMGENK